MDFNTQRQPTTSSVLMSYRKELDGLRGLALILVLMYHAGFSWLSGGFIAIDIFFVLSGYLITNIILNDIDLQRFSFKNFYDRRMRRIAPAFYAIIFLTFVPAWFILVPLDMESFAISNLSASTFVSNLYFWLDANYFSSEAELKPLLHTWSLAVEFQFYLFFPILIILIRKLLPKYLTPIITALFLISLLICQWGAINSPTANYYFLPTRMWEFLYGTLIALAMLDGKFQAFSNKLSNNNADLLSFIGFLLIVVPLFTFQKQFLYPSFYTLFPTTGSALLILFCDKSKFLLAFFKFRLLVGFGLISYSAYLIHQPLYVFARQLGYSTHQTSIGIALIITTLLLAILSWKYIESPLRDKKRIASKPFYLIILAMVFANLGTSIIAQKTDGLAFRFHLPEVLDNKFELAQHKNGWCFYSVDSNRYLPVGIEGTTCNIGQIDNPRYTALLFGDSTTASFEPFWNQIGQQLNIKINVVSTNWCYPSQSDNYLWTKDTPAYAQCLYNRKFLSEHYQEYDFIILSSVWSKLVQDNVYDESVALIKSLVEDKNKKVVLMAQTPILDRFAILRTIYHQRPISFEERDGLAISLNTELENLANNNANIYFINRIQMFGPNKQEQLLTDEGLPYSLDGIHLSIYGSLKAADIFAAQSNLTSFTEFIENSN
ncbi:acyltransferase family protein [Sessilibacter sp. MAH4]